MKAVAYPLLIPKADEFSPEEFRMITVSPAAAAAVKDAMAKASQSEGGLRILVKEGGCAGYQYVVDLDPQQRNDDAVVEADGVRVLIDPVSQPHLIGMTLGFRQDLSGSGFTFENPNASSTCGCQKSFN